ncbi:Ig-like domain-containing protein [Longimicrobium sp.]|uniref:Ig-like domain-containing protein n=1 Tax=Longimicrobium sp. TaxID=2029185 RepID=UPI003B3A5CBE
MRMMASAAALLLGWFAAGCNGEVVGGGQRPAAVLVVAGDLQTATVGKEVPQPLVVRVVDERNRPVKDQLVNFVVTAGGGSVFAGSANTNAQGEARERWTLGTVAGDTQRVEARAVDPATGEALVFAVFRAVGTPDVPAAVAAVGGSSLTGLPSLPLADSVAVFVRDAYGNGVPGQTVAWTVKQGGGSVSPASSVTGANGVARTRWTLGPQYEGAQVLEAAVGLTLSTQFTANAQLPADATLVRVSGDAQTGTVGHVLDQPLVVRVQRADGSPIAGIPVTFTLPPLYGSISPATGVTDADGRVSARWTLPQHPFAMQVTASIPTGASVTFTGSSRPGPLASLQKLSGDGQRGRAGSVLADSLAVRAMDVYGNALSGVQVTWSAGAGSVSPATAVTGADGRAATAYTLPSASGAATVQVSAAGVQPVSFTATSEASPVYMRVLQPTPGSVLGDSVLVVVAIDSASASVAAVVASASGRAVTLAPGATPGQVTGTLRLAGTPAGPTELRVRAETVNGDTAVVSVPFIHDAPPALSVAAPLRNTVARPSLRLDLDCTDDAGPCTSVSVRAFGGAGAGQEVASGGTGVHGTVSLAAYDGRLVVLQYTGTDSRGQTRVLNDTVYVESSTRLTEIASAGADVLDADADGGRVLYADAAGSVWMRAGATETLLAAGVAPREARLHPWGAFFGGTRVYDWNRGTLHDLGTLNADLEVDGAWAIWNDGPTLYRRNLDAASSVTVHGNTINNRNDVTAGGVVVFGTGAAATPESSYEIFRYDGSGTTAITSDADGAFWNLYPLTDGTNVIFVKRDSRRLGEFVTLWRDGTETVLTEERANTVPRIHYDVNGGWAAWIRPDGAGLPQQVYTRAPDGTERVVTAFGLSKELRALGPDGTVVYSQGGWMYVIRAPYNTAPVQIAHDFGRQILPRFVDGQLLFFLGRTVFRVND